MTLKYYPGPDSVLNAFHVFIQFRDHDNSDKLGTVVTHLLQ